MQKKNKILKNNKGIALITLVVAVLMMLVISSIIIFNTTSHLKINNLNNMYNDIRVLNEQVFLYYSKYNELPIESEEYAFQIPNDNMSEAEFHIIDIDKIDRNIKSNLNYGTDYYDKNYNGTNIYIINTITHQIFYVQGIKVDDTTYYTIPGESNIYQNISVDEIVANPPILENDLKPIIYDEQNGIVQVSNYDKNWYDYSENTDLSKWARAEITDTEIYMWIPRYAYNTETNEIVFLKGITNNPILEKDITGDEWLIPDAFQNKEKEQLTGIWIYLGEDYKKIKSKIDLIKAVYDLTGKDNTKGTTNTSITGANYTYYNPVIPVGFKTVPTKDASWKSTNGIQVDGWNNGLVIEDEDGNQFVWVPVDGTNVKYESWCENGVSYTECTTDLENMPITKEETQINKYDGFYIARYEASNNNEIPQSKAKKDLWAYVDYNNSIKISSTYAEYLYGKNNSITIKSCIPTGTMWDTIMKWIENENNGLTIDSRDWGNYKDSIIDENVEYGKYLKTGNSEFWKKKNIYDIAGNVHEWTLEELKSDNSITLMRGGWATTSGTKYPASSRYKISKTDKEYSRKRF